MAWLDSVFSIVGFVIPMYLDLYAEICKDPRAPEEVQRVLAAYLPGLQVVDEVASVLLAMERADVEHLIVQKPQVGIKIISLLSERLHYYETRMEDVTLKDVPARLASLILFLVESSWRACAWRRAASGQ